MNLAWLKQQRHALMVFADQAVVSACNFLFGLAMARILGVQGYGHWVLLYAVILYANAYSSALVQMPLATLLPHKESGSERTDMLRGSLALQIALSSCLAMALVCGFELLRILAPDWYAPGLSVPIAVSTLAFQVHDWMRRACFVDGRAHHALLIDLIGYGGQLAGIMIVASLSVVTAQIGFIVLAVSYGAGICAGFFVLRHIPSFSAARKLLSDTWRTSRDFFLSWQFQWLGTQGVLFVGAATLGTQAAGAIRASQNLLGPTNVLFQAVENLVPVRCAVHYKTTGNSGLRSYLLKVAAFGGGPLVVIFAVIAFFGTESLALAYGNDYASFGYLVGFQCFYLMMSFFSRLLGYWRRTWKQTGAILISSIVSALIANGLAAIAVESLSDRGIMWALIAGTVCSSLVLIAWPRKVREEGHA